MEWRSTARVMRLRRRGRGRVQLLGGNLQPRIWRVHFLEPHRSRMSPIRGSTLSPRRQGRTKSHGSSVNT
eukprot:7072513-Pyramimonas_sp.AAC.1